MDFSDELKKRKPNMSANSVKTYNSLLRSVYKNVFGNINDVSLKQFEDHKQIMEFLNEKSFGTRKTYLAALVCIAPDVAEYKKQMMEDIKEYNDETSKSELTDKLENSAINPEEIEALADRLKRDAELLFKKKSPRLADLMDIQNYIILSLYYGHIVPRRSLDYVDMKYQNYDKDKDNYMDLKKERFVFNKFKTAQKMGKELKGEQTLDIPPALKKILTKWIAIIPKEIDNLLFNTNLEPLSSVTLNQRLNALFGGKKGVNALRHYYLTSKYKELMILNEKMGDEMEQMGSSSAQAKVYVKIHDKE
jgi:DNA-binding ferritin-like protein (Dps family)